MDFHSEQRGQGEADDGRNFDHFFRVRGSFAAVGKRLIATAGANLEASRSDSLQSDVCYQSAYFENSLQS
jgi:hypothetical protein